MGFALRAMLAGGGAGLVLTATMLLLRLALAVPSFPERIADTVILLLPQALFSAGIERFGFAAKPLLFVGIVAAQVALAALGGLIYGALAFVLAGRLDLINPALGGAAGLFLGIASDLVLLPALGAGNSPIDGATIAGVLAMAALPGLAYGLALVALLWLLTPPRARRLTATGSFGVARARLARRTVIAMSIPALGVLVTAGALRRLLAAATAPTTPASVAQLPAAPLATAPSATATPSPPTAAAIPSTLTTAPGTPAALTPPSAPTTVPTAASGATAVGSPPPAAGSIAGGLPSRAGLATPTIPATASTLPTAVAGGATIPAGVSPLITPSDQFYLISKNLLDPLLRAEGWQLAISGLVERQQTLRHNDLLALPPTRLAATLQCISNEPGGDLIGTAIWTGVPLRTILAGAGVRPGATHVIFTCADDYVERLTIEQALDPATLLVYAMNDAPLSARHGFPTRLIAAGRYGMKNPKWLTGIEIVNGATPSYWSQRGWDPDAPVQVFTRVDTPARAIGLWPVAVGGVAYAGDRGIARVEISADGGATWLPAEHEPALSPVTWVRWVAQWTPPGPGTYTLSARAFEADGTPQVATTRTLNARGSTGYGRREVTVAP
jgi:DMSO/TMAO reductase YedYZ molybdopterin-dependent catalytic subunit